MKFKLIIVLFAMFTQADNNPDDHLIIFKKGGVSNPNLSFVNPPAGWTGNKVGPKNEFLNIDSVKMPNLGDVIRWKTKRNPQEDEKKQDTFLLKVEKDLTFLRSKEDVLVWLGHSTFYIRIDGISIITDPVFYNILLVKRHSAMPFDPALITNIDYIFVSHNHRDHCDKKSLQLLCKNNPKATVLAGLGMNTLIKKWVGNKIEEAGWFQKYKTPDNVRIVFLPAQHWSKRGITDTNKRLWGSFAVNIGEKSFYFAGDTGWGSHFEYIGKSLGPFDVCLLPIGAYSPRWFMKSAHINPEEALEAFSLLQGKKLIPMHYGTFDLSDEPMGEPVRLVQEGFGKLKHGEEIACPPVGKVVKL